MSTNISSRKERIRERMRKRQKRELYNLVHHERRTFKSLFALIICILMALVLFISASLVNLVR